MLNGRADCPYGASPLQDRGLSRCQCGAHRLMQLLQILYSKGQLSSVRAGRQEGDRGGDRGEQRGKTGSAIAY